MLPWHSFPYEIQHLIVVELVASFDGIRELYNLLLTSKSLHDRLVGAPSRGIPQDDRLYFLLYKSLFDDQAGRRRLAIKHTPNAYAQVFKYRCHLLNRIRSASWQSLDSDQLLRGLWEIYLMLLEDDGNNMRQLEAAGVKPFLLDQLLTRIENDLDEDGWPRETTHLQLSAASFTIMSDRGNVLFYFSSATRP